MITAFVGTRDDESIASIRGNGKTCSMTGTSYLDYLAGRKVWANYETDFAEETIGFQAMINKIRKEYQAGVDRDLILCITEMQQIINSIGSKTDQVLFIDMFASQLRKYDVDLYYDTQRFNNIHKRLRIHTDNIFMPYKTHMDNEPCNFDRCKKEHKIFLYSLKPPRRQWLRVFHAPNVGKHYNSKEIVYDTLIIPKHGEVD